MILLIILLFLVLSSIDILPLYQKKSWKEIAVYSLFMLISLSLATALILEIEVTNPTDVITAIFRPLSPLK